MTEQEVIIEEAQVSDAAALSNLLERVSQETDFIVADSILSQEDMAIFLERHLAAVNEICLVVRVGRELAGVLNVSSSDSSQTNHIGDIFIAVRKEYWGYGLGSLLMEVALDWACHTPMIRRLELTVQAEIAKLFTFMKNSVLRLKLLKNVAQKLKMENFLMSTR